MRAVGYRTQASPLAREQQTMALKLLVIAGQNADYRRLFAGDTDIVEVEQCPWRDMDVVSYPDGPVVHIKPLPVTLHPGGSGMGDLSAWLSSGRKGEERAKRKGKKKSKKGGKGAEDDVAKGPTRVSTTAVTDLSSYRAFPSIHATDQLRSRTFQPDMVLIRSFALGTPDHDWRLKLYGLIHSGVPLINSAASWVWSVEKALCWGKLRACKLRDPTFPLIQQSYYSSTAVATFPPDFPAVLKVGSASQGVGKARMPSAAAWTDTLSLLQMNPDQYFVSEPLVTWRADVRVQKIGGHFRAIRRTKTADEDIGMKSASSSPAAWKANDAFGIREEDVKVKGRWKRWLELAADELSMDICGMDLLLDEDGNEYLLEVNSSSIGLSSRHFDEDMGYIRELVLQKAREKLSQAHR